MFCSSMYNREKYNKHISSNVNFYDRIMCLKSIIQINLINRYYVKANLKITSCNVYILPVEIYIALKLDTSKHPEKKHRYLNDNRFKPAVLYDTALQHLKQPICHIRKKKKKKTNFYNLINCCWQKTARKNKLILVLIQGVRIIEKRFNYPGKKYEMCAQYVVFPFCRHSKNSTKKTVRAYKDTGILLLL